MNVAGLYSPGKRGLLALLLIVVLLTGSVFLQYSLNETPERKAGEEENALDSAASSILDLLGGIRETVAAVLWSKTHDIYHAYSVDEHSSVALFPYYWLVIKLDPHYVMAYYYTSWMLAYNDRVEDALRMAHEGIANNPSASILYYNLSSIYLFYLKDPLAAQSYIDHAIQLDAADRGSEFYGISYEELRHVIGMILAGETTIPDVHETVESLEEFGDGGCDPETCTDPTHRHHHDHNH